MNTNNKPCNYRFHWTDNECGRDSVWRIERKSGLLHACSWHVRNMCSHDDMESFVVGIADFNCSMVLCRDEKGNFYLYR